MQIVGFKQTFVHQLTRKVNDDSAFYVDDNVNSSAGKLHDTKINPGPL